MKSALFSILLAFSVADEVFAQNGAIQGTLVDAQSAAIPTAKVTATDVIKSLLVRETTSSTDGTFRLAPLAPGRYTVKITAPGMKPVEQQDLVLDVNQTMNLGTMRMEVGATTDTVMVTGETPQIETATSDKSFVITGNQVIEQSLNGRDWQSLLRTLPGVVSNDASDFRLAFNNTDSFNVNGLRGSMNNVYVRQNPRMPVRPARKRRSVSPESHMSNAAI